MQAFLLNVIDHVIFSLETWKVKIYIYIYIYIYILGVVKRNPLFFPSISCKNNGFLFTTPNIYNTYKFLHIHTYTKEFIRYRESYMIPKS